MSAAEIQRIVSERIHAIREVRDDGATIRVPEPQWHAPGPDGANWDMPNWGNITGYEADVFAICARARDEFELAT
jgi:hypothetical protein